MSGLELTGRCEVGAFTLDVAMAARPTQAVAVIGPNGSGKSTLLRAVAGLGRLSAGTLRIGDRIVDDPARGVFVPTAGRRIGMVFSDHRLFPSMSALENVAFGLRSRGTPAAAARTAAHEWLDRLGLSALTGRRPNQLSGGQAQRVAIARALASEPDILLLDEPLAALDVATRADVQAALAEHVAGFAGPVLLVTHDPLEAVLLASDIVVLEAGRVVQTATPAEVTRRPATAYVARVVGVNLWGGLGDGTTSVALTDGGTVVAAEPVSGPVLVSSSPSSLTLHTSEPVDSSARNVWAGRIASLAVVGDAASGAIRARVEGPPMASVDLTPAAVAELGLAAGRPVWISVKATALTVYPDRRSAGARSADRGSPTTS